MPEITVNLIARESVTIEISDEELQDLKENGDLTDELAERAIDEAGPTAYWDIDEDYEPYEIEE